MCFEFAGLTPLVEQNLDLDVFLSKLGSKAEIGQPYPRFPLRCVPSLYYIRCGRCVAGYRTISSSKCDTSVVAESECKLAAAEINEAYLGRTTCSGSNCAPRGCYLFSSSNDASGVYWNNEKSGGCTSDRACICTQGTVRQMIEAVILVFGTSPCLRIDVVICLIVALLT